MRFRRRAPVLAAAMMLLLGAAACGADDAPTTKPKTEPTETTSATPTEPASPTEPAWEDNYTKKQLAAYEGPHRCASPGHAARAPQPVAASA